MRKSKALLMALGMAAVVGDGQKLMGDSIDGERLRYPSIVGINYSSPIYYPKKHTIESYRSQQRRAKKR
jgi:hypothetical protein